MERELPQIEDAQSRIPASRSGRPELDLGDGRVLVLDGDPLPPDDLPLFEAP